MLLEFKGLFFIFFAYIKVLLAGFGVTLLNV